MSRSEDFKQAALIPAHTPTDEIASARRWAQKSVGIGAKVHYVSPDDNHQRTHQIKVTASPRRRGEYRPTVAELEWHPNTGTVMMVSTQPRYRNRGVASGMWSIAKALGEEFDGISRPQHSTVQTPMGKQWARKVGD